MHAWVRKLVALSAPPPCDSAALHPIYSPSHRSPAPFRRSQDFLQEHAIRLEHLVPADSAERSSEMVTEGTVVAPQAGPRGGRAAGWVSGWVPCLGLPLGAPPPPPHSAHGHLRRSTSH